MKKLVYTVLVFSILFCSLSFAQTTSSDELVVKPAGKDTWKVQNSRGEQVATLRAAEDGAYSVQLMNGEYVGYILRNGDLKKPQRHPQITPNEAKLYLDIWAAIQKMR